MISRTLLLVALCLAITRSIAPAAPTTTAASQPASVEQWGTFELTLPGPVVGNPFNDVSVSARFTSSTQYIDVAGFYDGNGTYRVRFSPNSPGDWHYLTHSNRAELDGKSGEFRCVAPGTNNHGPVAVRNTFHFAYADGSPFKPIGTTCYYWAQQTDQARDQTVATLAKSPFNKIRMFLIPAEEFNASGMTPFVSTAPKKWDFSQYNPKYFQSIEKRVGQLNDLGIQADLILFNPYEHTGFAYAGSPNDERYIRYVTARFAAYRNVWWSLANEFDLFKNKTDDDWDRYFHIVDQSDPYHHLRSIHHSMRLYDYTKPWVTHASLQNGSAVEDFGRAELYRDPFQKPIMLDEVKYEGDLPQRWGRLTGQEMTSRFWQGIIAGTYVTHGESFNLPNQNTWYVRGGELIGQSPPRIAFLKKILDTAPAGGIDPIDKWQDVHTAGVAGSYYLIYFGNEKPDSWLFELPAAGLKNGMKFHVDVLDTWDMTVTPDTDEFVISVDGKYRVHSRGKGKVSLPKKPYLALRVSVIPDSK